MLIHKWQKKQVALYTKLLHYIACHVKILKSQGKSKKRYNTRRLLLSHPKTKRVSLSPFMKGCQDNMVQKMCKEGGLRLCALNVTLIYKKAFVHITRSLVFFLIPPSLAFLVHAHRKQEYIALPC